MCVYVGVYMYVCMYVYILYILGGPRGCSVLQGGRGEADV